MRNLFAITNVTMANIVLNLICDLNEKSNDIKVCRKRYIQNKRRNLLFMSLLQNKTRRIPKVTDYMKTINTYPDDVFFDHFRMSRETFKALHSALKPFWTRNSKGRLPHTLKECLYITLWKLCNGSVTFRQLSDRFDVGKGTTHKIFYKTIKAICSLKNQISWPSVTQQKVVMEEFQNSRENPFPYVVGCVDGTHFRIPRPKVDAISYYSRKGIYTINMQGICDSKFRFLDVFIGYPGSCHDANLWKNSPIYKSITSGKVKLAENAIILGDSAYPISKFLLAPYRDNGHLSREEKKFNYCLSSTRVFIEQAFGILKNKFRILDRFHASSPSNISKIVFACTILHNFIINNGSPSEYEILNTETVEDTYTQRSDITASTVTDDNDGISLRRNLTTLFSC